MRGGGRTAACPDMMNGVWSTEIPRQARIRHSQQITYCLETQDQMVGTTPGSNSLRRLHGGKLFNPSLSRRPEQHKKRGRWRADVGPGIGRMRVVKHGTACLYSVLAP